MPALEAAGLGPRFDAIVTADDVYRGKPDPEGYLYAAQVGCGCLTAGPCWAGSWNAACLRLCRATLQPAAALEPAFALHSVWLKHAISSAHTCPAPLHSFGVCRRSSGRRCAAW